MEDRVVGVAKGTDRCMEGDGLNKHTPLIHVLYEGCLKNCKELGRKGDINPKVNAQADSVHIKECGQEPSGWDFRGKSRAELFP